MTGHAGVLLLQGDDTDMAHEWAVHRLLGEKLGAVLGCPLAGCYEAQRHRSGRYYFLPDDTLVGDVSQYAIEGPQDLFGGVVERAFMATKVISHPLPDNPRRMPEGWSTQLAQQITPVTLAGYSVFDLDDATLAGRRLLRDGPVRLKNVMAKAGRGQRLVRDAGELEQALAELDESCVQRHGLVLEENLHQVETFSVGQISVGDHTLSYYGTQQLTRDNHGIEVYGGSTLNIVRGDWLALMALRMSPGARLAAQQARLYELAVFEAYPGIYASRRNYDVAQGLGASGQQHSGVLEQSWRVGGASAAELFALHALLADSSLQQVRASTFECYGDVAAPPGATCLYQGYEGEMGLLSKYVTVQPA